MRYKLIEIFLLRLCLSLLLLLEMSLPINITIYGHQHQVNDTGGNDHNGSKVVILTFGDTHKSQFATAKPMLD
jgi:hypothetical protein